MITRKINFWLFIFFLLLQNSAVAADNTLWSALKSGGYVVLIRHAITDPGIGDPPGFTIGDCGTQRNLSAQGRIDARQIGEAFRSRNIPISEVLSSRWCRCLETARLAFGKATPWAMLDSLFNAPSRATEEKTHEVLAVASRRPASGNLILVTHNQNIHALTGVSAASGEMVIVAPEGSGKIKVVGRLPVSRI